MTIDTLSYDCKQICLSVYYNNHRDQEESWLLHRDQLLILIKTASFTSLTEVAKNKN